MPHRNKNKFPLYFFGIVVSVLLVIFIVHQIDLRRLEKDGVYVLGYVAKTTNSKNGILYTCYYKYKSVGYEAKFTDVNRGLKEGDLLFFKISSSKPSIHLDLNEKVPSCIKPNEAPDTGWEQLPKCP